MSSAATAPCFSLLVHIRRLDASGLVLYIRIGKSDISRLGLRHGQLIEIDLGRVRVAGILKTSGGSPWLAPAAGSSNAAITAALRGGGFEHGADAEATAHLLNSGPWPDQALDVASTGAVARRPLKSRGHPLRIDPNEAVQAVLDYNRASYRGRPNIVLDRHAYRRFRRGLSENLKQLTNQIAFVGEQYGGAQERFLPRRIRAEAALIAANLLRVHGQWVKAVQEAKPLIRKVPNKRTLVFLFTPFVATKAWGVWVSKMLHLLRPDVFPILDSNAKKPLGLRTIGSSSRDYHRFCFNFRGALLANRKALAAARVTDAGQSPTDLKLLDKILFQLGKRMN